MKNVLKTDYSLEIDVIDPICLDKNGNEVKEESQEEIPEKREKFRPFLEETRTPLKKSKGNQFNFNQLVDNIFAWAKTLPSACAYACHR
ncbi:hypothetical protein HN014_22450 (plasmid) [Aquimarina sp. TRL1]|uniref:hypothetical protein n=1 Tax=Aquimarina sp. (strain TRL1) TaxID=2736252 RepID=UPI00158DD69C|nr:hypothetical protein [Aquimarina sp. TRL1]QKX07763.1 hypothetical protein HN014_22450 [Aquimarina sp. TRL1]